MDDAGARRDALALRYSRRASLLFLLAAAAYLVLPNPWTLLGAVCGGAALVNEVQAFRAFGVVRDSGTLRAMSAVSILACALLTVLCAAPFVLDVAEPAQRECRQGANTEAARAACDERLGRPPGGSLLGP